MSYSDSCPLQQILDVKSTLKVTSFSFNAVSFVRNTYQPYLLLEVTKIYM